MLIVPVLSWLAFECVSASLSKWDVDNGDAPPPLAAPPGKSEALAGLAMRRLDDAENSDDFAEVEALSAEALTSKPIAIEPIRVLALTAERRGDQERAQTLMQMAEKRSWRNPLVENWLLGHSANAGDFGAALRRTDALLRTSTGEVYNSAIAALAQLAVDNRATAALAEFLGASPPWRGNFLSMLFGNVSSLDASQRLITAMASMPQPVTPAELGDYLATLVVNGEFQQAYAAWLASLPPAASSVPYVYNGDFKRVPGQSPFDWILADKRVAGVSVEAVDPPADGQGLRLEFGGRRVSRPLASELLILPEGSYVLSAKAKLDNLDNERGLWWTVRCADGDKALLGTTDRVSGTMPWQSLEARFDVPEGCNAQWLQVEVAGRVALEQRISGVAWFQDLAISRDESAATQ